MSLIGNISSIVASKTPPKWLQTAFVKTAKEGPAAMVIPETAVIAGRSGAAAQRGGFLEFQERILEESVVAVIWLWGVKTLGKVFDKAWKKFFPGLQHLNPKVAWLKDFLKKPNHVGLNPQEMFTRNAADRSKLLAVKGAKWLFSVGSTIGIVALLIPWLNQKKTEWIINKYYKNPEKKPQAKQPAMAASQAANHFSNPYPASVPNWNPMAPSQGVNPNAWQPQTAFAPNYPQFAGGQPASRSSCNNTSTKPVQFGGMGNMMQALGDLVEDTAYGSILAVDGGITGGRMYVAGQRSIFESLEILFRDGVSLYFYILFAPHMMKLMSKVIDPLFKTNTLLEPKVSERFNQLLCEKLGIPNEAGQLSQAMKAEGKSIAEIRKALLGSTHPALNAPEGYLRYNLRAASKSQFADLFGKESRIFFNKPGIQEAMAAYLKRQPGDKITADQIQQLIQQVQQGLGNFKDLSARDKGNLVTSIKNAFKHTAGIDISLSSATNPVVEQAQNAHKIGQAVPKLSGDEVQELLQRSHQMAQRDALDQVNTMFRRSSLLTGEFLNPAYKPLQEQTELVADWIDRAVNHGVSLQGKLGQETHELTDALKTLQRKNKLTPELTAFLKREGGVNAQNISQLLELLQHTPQKHLQFLTHPLQKIKNQASQLEAILSPYQWLEKANLPQELLEALKANFQKAAGRPEKTIEALNQGLISALRQQPNQAALPVLEHYAGEIQKYLSGDKGRLFSLHLAEEGKAALDQKLAELLQGGLVNDEKALKEALGITDYLTEDSRKYANEAKASEMRALFKRQSEKLLGHLEVDAQQGLREKVSLKKLLTLLDNTHALNRNLHYLMRGTALVGTMIGLGYLIPKMQYALTKKLTGKNEHPGIASVSGHDTPETPKPKGVWDQSLFLTPPLQRNNFSIFQQQMPAQGQQH